MMIVIIILLVVLLGAIGAMGWFLLNNKGGANPDDPNATPPPITAVPGATLTMDELTPIDLGDTRTNLLTGTDNIPHTALVSFVVNINNSDKKNSAAFIATFNSHLQTANSVALAVVSSKTFEEMQRPDAQTIVANEVLAKLQEKFNSSLIVSVEVYNKYVQ